MKKITAFICAAALVFAFSACQSTPPQDNNSSGQTERELKEQGVEWTSELLEGYLNRDTSAEMAYAGPFYFGSFDGISPDSRTYSEQRRDKADEVLEIIDEGIDVMAQLDARLREEREILGWYVQEIQKIDQNSKSFTDRVYGATKGNALSEALSGLMVMHAKADEMERSAEWGFFKFRVYADWIELTNLYTAEAASLTSRTTALYYLLESDANTAYSELNKQFIEKIDPVSEQASELLSELYYMTALARNGEKIIFTADYNFASQALKEIDNQIAKAKKTLDEYEGGNELVSEKTFALLESKLADLSAYRDGISSYLEAIPSEELVSENEFAMAGYGNYFALVPLAKAQTDIPGWFQQKVKNTIKNVRFVKDMSFAAVRVTGQKIKELYDESGAHEAVKDGAQIFNGGLEMANSSVEVAVYGLQGLYYGDMSWADFKKRIEDEKNEVYQRFLEGKLGKDQYNEMIRQMDLIKDSTDRFVNDISEFAGDMTGILTGQPKVGKFVKTVSKHVGHEAKSALDTATEFSKNIAIVMHPETSKEDTRKAMLGIYTALKGARDEEGKLKTVEMPDLTKLAKEKGWEQAVKDMGLSEEEEKEFIEQLKEVFQEQLKDKETADKTVKDGQKPADKDDQKSESEDAAKQPAKTAADRIAQEIANNPDITDEEIADLIIAEIMRDLPPAGEKKADADEDDINKDGDDDGVENEYDNCEKTANAEQTDTDMDGLGDACDPDCSGDADGDGVCNEIDNCPQTPNEDQADSDNDSMGNVCDFDAPHISEIAGSWPGTITVKEVYVSEDLRAQAEAEGCDVAELEATKDVPKPVSITINPTGETGGEIIMSGADMGEQKIPFTYVDGVLKAAKDEDDAAMNIEMNFNRNTSTGKVDLDYMGGNAKIQADLDLEK